MVRLLLSAMLTLALVACTDRSTEEESKVDREAPCEAFCPVYMGEECGPEEKTYTSEAECFDACISDGDTAWEPCAEERAESLYCIARLDCETSRLYYSDPIDGPCWEASDAWSVCRAEAKWIK